MLRNRITQRVKTSITSLTKHWNPVTISDSPHMSENERKTFVELLKDTKTYVEYGSGGSTKLAAEHVNTIISVENDFRFARELQKNLSQTAQDVDIVINYADLGPSGNWGYPVFTFKTPRFQQRRDKYVSAPWKDLRSKNQKPDLILIDGRFRIASTLFSLQKLGEDFADTAFFFHDYKKRPFYHAIEPFIDIEEEVDTAIVFRKKDDITQGNLEAAYQQHSLNWR